MFILHFSISFFLLCIYLIDAAPSSSSSTLNAPSASLKYPNITTATSLQLNHCLQGIRNRREFRKLSQSEWQLFIQAILNLQKGTSPTSYDRFAKMHIDIAPETHKFPLFFPWHRGFVASFEREIQQFDSSIMIPYWEWTFDNQAPELSPLFQADFMGGNGKGAQNCVVDGPFKSWKPAYPSFGCLKRQFSSNVTDRIPASYPIEVVNFLLSKATSFVDLWAGFEGPIHNFIHVNIGGHMVFKNSVSDPIFWLVHGYVDKVWWKWQRMHPSLAFDYGGLNLDHSQAKLSDTLFTYPENTVEDVMNTTALCYEYEEFTPPLSFYSSHSDGKDNDLQQFFQIREEIITPEANYNISKDDRTNLLALRMPDRLPSSFINSMNSTGSVITRFEEAYQDLIIRLNQRSDYVSACSLGMKPEFLSKLIDRARANQFHSPVVFTADSQRRQRRLTISVKNLKGLKSENLVELSKLIIQQFL